MTRKTTLTATGILILLILLFAALEAFFAYYGRRYPFMFRHTLEPRTITEEGARRFLESAWFDPRLGWDADPVARNLEKGRDYWAQSYGDSFTYGAEVEDHATWQAAHFRSTGRRILNLGVSGYGLDQAVLKFEKYGERFPAERAILALNRQEYRRLGARYAYFCFASVDFVNLFRYAFKPVFRPSSGGWKLELPPCREPACLTGLLRDEPEKLRTMLSREDVCYQENERRPFLRFPYSVNFIRALAREIRDRPGPWGAGAGPLAEDRTFALTLHLIERFERHCARLGIRPLYLLLYGPREIPFVGDEARPDARLIDHLRDRGLPFVDAGAALVASGADPADLAARGGHLNEAGNRLVAEAISAAPR